MRKNYFFKVLNLVTHEVAYHSYENASNSKKEELKKLIDDGKVILTCCCQNEIEQRIRKDMAFYNAKKNVEHDRNCCRYNHYKSNVHYESGWKKNGDRFAVRIEGLIPKKEREAPEESTQSQPGSYSGEGGTQQGEATMLGFSSRLNLMAWKHAVMKQSIMPKDKEDVLKKVFGQLKFIDIYISKRTKRSLQELIYKRKDISSMKKGDFRFVYMTYESSETVIYDTDEKFFVYCRSAFGKPAKFYCDKELWVKEYQKESEHSKEYFIAGFAEKKRKRTSILTLTSFTVMPITKQGLFVESSKEKEAYEASVENDLLFYKPFEPIPEYGNYTPDMFYFTEKKPVIGEVFGLTKEDYLEKRKLKLEASQKPEFVEKYVFWYWDAYKKDPLQLPNLT